MLHDNARTLDAPLSPADLALLEDAFSTVCEIRGYLPASPKAEELARTLLSFFQSGIRNRNQLIAMMTGRRFP
jgi:hypothetical protein